FYEQTNPTGPEIIDTEDWGVRGKIQFAPGELFFFDDVRIVASGYRLDHVGSDANVKNQFDPSPLANLLGASATATPYEAGSDLPDTNRTQMEGLNLKATLGLHWLDLVSITAYQDVRNQGYVDYDATPAHGAGFGGPNFAKTFSQEVQLISKDWEHFEWVAGGYYLTGDAGFVPLNFFLGTPLPAFPLPVLTQLLSNPPVLPLPELPGPNVTLPSNQIPVPVPIPELPVPSVPGNAVYVYVPLATIVDTDAYAGFGQLTWKPVDWLRLTGGLRYSTETRALSRNEIYQPGFITDPASVDTDPPPFPRGTPIVRRTPRSKDFSNVSPKFGIELPFEDLWFADSLLLYATHTKGFKSGTYNPVAVVEEPLPVKEEEVTAIEFGFKSDLFDRNVRLNVAAFTYDYDNLQLQTIALTSGGAVRLENAGKATVRGLDFDLVWAPLDRLELSLGGALLHSEYDECNCSGFDPNTGLAFKGDFSGNQLVRAPEFTGTAQASYGFDVPGGSGEIAGTAYYNDGYWFDAQNTFFQGSYTLYGARLSYLHDWSSLRFTLYGANLSDEEYLVNGNVNDFGRFGTYASPRSFGGRVEWRFDA
ncbi:MAG: TonB-dependent receptor, partial [Candidatus Binatia bacterium]